MDLYPDCPDHSADEMVYTEARLEHALRVFRETSSYLCKKGLPSENLERHLRSKYAFRKSSRIAPITNVTLWQDKSNGSEDDEYNPDKERKTLNTKKKRKPEQKRKAEDAGNQERSIKRSKYEEKGNSAYVSFTLTSEKAKQLLRNLSIAHKTDLASFEKANPDKAEPTYWKRYGNSNGSASARRDSKLDVLSDNSLTVVDLNNEPGLESCVLPTSLRNGKVRQKPKDKEVDSATDGVLKYDQDVAQEANAMTSRESSNVIQKKPLSQTGINGRSGDQTSSMWKTTKLDNDDFDPEIQEPANTHKDTNCKGSINTSINANPKRKSPPLVVSQIDDFSFSKARSFLDQPGLITIETAYAHPIDFRFMPPVGQRCDFCADWRVGVLGHGKRTIQVFIDPEHPTQFQEVGDGHRSFGKPCTKMCVSCALDRLLIMRCHSMDQDITRSEAASRQRSQTMPAFSRIPGVVYSMHNLDLYQRRLLPKAGTPEASAPPSRNGPLPTCSLCPAVAMWRCCKWQKTDKMKKPRRIPDEADSTISATISLSSFSPTPPTTPTIGLTNGHKKKLSIISISDSDDELPFTKPNAAVTSQSPFPRALSTVSANSSQQGLGPPLKGCGLKLCTACKTFVEERCDGLLDKKRIVRWLREESKIKVGRADLDWLFKGSNLDRTYEVGARR